MVLVVAPSWVQHQFLFLIVEPGLGALCGLVSFIYMGGLMFAEGAYPYELNRMGRARLLWWLRKLLGSLRLYDSLFWIWMILKSAAAVFRYWHSGWHSLPCSKV